MPGAPGSTGVSGGSDSGSRADDVLNRMTWGNLGMPGAEIIPAAFTTGTTGPSVVIYDLATYADFPRPWASDAHEVQALQNDTWQPAREDFDPVAHASTSASGQAARPFSQQASSLAELINSVIYFAPKMVHAFSNQPPFSTRVNRLNLFLYCGSNSLELQGTLKTNGTRVSIDNPALGINSSVLDKNILDAVANNSANASTLTKLRQAWANNAEIWLYSSGGVADDALAQAFATFMGASVRAFNEPFWVLPQFDVTQKVILSRDEVGIGAHFKAALARRTKLLHSLDSLSLRRFAP
jgi:hypothetical protein